MTQQITVTSDNEYISKIPESTLEAMKQFFYEAGVFQKILDIKAKGELK